MDGKIRPCEGCGNPDPWARHPKKERMTGKVYEECNRCFDSSIPQNPDVYFKEPYWDENLHDKDNPSWNPRKGTYIHSRGYKAYLLKKLGWAEGGDRIRGNRNFDPISHKHAMKSLERRF